MKYIIYPALLLFVAAIFYACNGEEEEEYHSNLEKIHALSSDSTLDYNGLSSLDLVDETDFTSVSENGDDTLFLIPQRMKHLVSFPCNNCHKNNDIEADYDSKDLKKSHWDIELVHAPKDMMNCTSCHDSDEITSLHTITGKNISLDESYKLCGQCHSTQLKDWKGGAHGKRLGGWVSPRISNSCVDCHDPHKPAFPVKWPARLNTAKISELLDN